MSINIGSNSFGLYLGSSKIAEAYVGSTKVYSSGQAGLPANTLRFQFSDTSYVPTVGASGCTATKGSWTAYDASSGIWDWTCNDTSWYKAFYKGLNGTVIGVGNTVELIAGSSNITAINTSFMFSSCYDLVGVSLFDTSSVTDMSLMFEGCSKLTNVPLFNTSSVTTMSEMFEDCSMLTSIPLFNTNSVTNMKYMFARCSRLTNVPLFNTSHVTDMSHMFRECSSLTSIPLFNTNSATSMTVMFYNCTQVQSGALALYTQAHTQDNPPLSKAYCFTNCGSNTITGAAELAQIPSSWGGTGA